MRIEYLSVPGSLCSSYFNFHVTGEGKGELNSTFVVDSGAWSEKYTAVLCMNTSRFPPVPDLYRACLNFGVAWGHRLMSSVSKAEKRLSKCLTTSLSPKIDFLAISQPSLFSSGGCRMPD